MNSAATPAASAAGWLARHGVVTAAGADIDPRTSLPSRIIHSATGMTLVLIPAGEFMMGSPEAEPDRQPQERQHRRVISKPFYLGETEVTTAQFRAFADARGFVTDAERGVYDNPTDPRTLRGAFAATPDGERDWNNSANWRNSFPNLPGEQPRDDYPVVHVSWSDARAFAAHFGMNLPTAAQWEYAARAGAATPYVWGNDPTAVAAFANARDESFRRRFNDATEARSFDDGFAFLAPVKSFKPNAWGLYDMIGNVEEWVEDAWAAYPPDGTDERASPPSAKAIADDAVGRVMRGGAWTSHVSHIRSASRTNMREHSRRDFIGFRLAIAID